VGIPSVLPLDIVTPNNGGSLVTAGCLIFIGIFCANLFV
jgi:quinoprotein glucose dehydrogenase